MNNENIASSDEQSPTEYEKPAVLWEEWLDVKASLVMACAKVNPIAGPPCDAGQAAS